MTENQFKNLTGREYIQPNGVEKYAYNIKSIHTSQGILELYEKRYMSDTQFYRYENVNIVTFMKVIDKDTFNEKTKFEKIE